MTRILNKPIEKKGSNERCVHFKPIDDGTLTGDDRFCAYSFECKQIGYRGVGVRVSSDEFGMDQYDFLCTGWKMEEGEFTVEVI